MGRSFALMIAAIMLQSVSARAEDRGLIAAMDSLQFRPPEAKGRAELVDGKVGKAVRFRFDADARSTFFTSNIRGNPDWDRAVGFSFWVKGDGQDGFGGIEFIYDEDYAVRYDVAFPVRGTEWTKVTVAWDDLIAVLPGPRAKPLGGPDGNQPSKLSALWIGKWWYWGDYPALSLAIDEIRLESRFERPVMPALPDEPLGRVLAKVKAGKPLTIVTMGDSLTDVRHWANREWSWPIDLKARIDRWTHSDVTITNPAIGGTQLKQGLVLIPTWLARAPEPDLVTIFFGGNDKAAGMTGEAFELACVDAVDRVRQATRGRAECPAHDHGPQPRCPQGYGRPRRGLPTRREGDQCRSGGYRALLHRGHRPGPLRPKSPLRPRSSPPQSGRT